MNEFHYTIEDSDQKNHHVKTPALDAHKLQDSRLNEVYIYKILENIGCSLQISVLISQLIPEFLAITNQDFAFTSKKFISADELKGGIFSNDIAYLRHTASIDLTANLLDLDDVTDNFGNSGVVVNTNKIKNPTNEIDLAEDIISVHN